MSMTSWRSLLCFLCLLLATEHLEIFSLEHDELEILLLVTTESKTAHWGAIELDTNLGTWSRSGTAMVEFSWAVSNVATDGESSTIDSGVKSNRLTRVLRGIGLSTCHLIFYLLNSPC